MTAKTALEQLQAEFIAKVQEEGVYRVLEWIGGWYGACARAYVEDEMANALGAHANDRQARELHNLDRMFQEASMVSNYSTSAGHNLMRQAIVARRAELLSNAPMCGGAARRERWEEVEARLAPKPAST